MARIPLSGARFEYDTVTSELIITIPEAMAPDHKEPVAFRPSMDVVFTIKVDKPKAYKSGDPTVAVADIAAEYAKQPKGARVSSQVRLGPSEPPATPTVTTPDEVEPNVEPAPIEVDPVDAADLPAPVDQSTAPVDPPVEPVTEAVIPEALDPDEQIEVPAENTPGTIEEDKDKAKATK